MTKNKEKAQEATADKKTNVAMTQHDSMFQNIKLPGGISTKATEYKNLAAKGDKWESPVFTIGSAPESTNLPKATSVTRKHHQTSSGGVRGPQNIQPGQSTFGQAEPATGGAGGYGNQSSGGFSNQVNEAFGSGQSQDYSLKNTGGGMNGGAPQGGVGQASYGQQGGTLLGANNPVLSGSA